VIARVHGKAVGGGVGLASAADISFAHESASVKLSELAVGIGPFVVGPAVERKIGKAAFMELTIQATEWKSATWAREKGLFAEVYSTVSDMDQAIKKLTQQLAVSNPEAMSALKKIFWEGTENWDTLLNDRAAVSGRLVNSDFTRKAIEKFKSR
jgi:methylglutaconyl-CoA hydratase